MFLAVLTALFCVLSVSAIDFTTGTAEGSDNAKILVSPRRGNGFSSCRFEDGFLYLTPCDWQTKETYDIPLDSTYSGGLEALKQIWTFCKTSNKYDNISFTDLNGNKITIVRVGAGRNTANVYIGVNKSAETIIAFIKQIKLASFSNGLNGSGNSIKRIENSVAMSNATAHVGFIGAFKVSELDYLFEPEQDNP